MIKWQLSEINSKQLKWFNFIIILQWAIACIRKQAKKSLAIFTPSLKSWTKSLTGNFKINFSCGAQKWELEISSNTSSSPKTQMILNPRNLSRKNRKVMELANTSKAKKKKFMTHILNFLFCLKSSKKKQKKVNTTKEDPIGSILKNKKLELLRCIERNIPWLKSADNWTFPSKTSRDGQNKTAKG